MVQIKDLVSRVGDRVRFRANSGAPKAGASKIYEQLDAAQKEIRVLELQPGTGEKRKSFKFYARRMLIKSSSRRRA